MGKNYLQKLEEFEKYLISTRSSVDLNKQGQYFTPYNLAREVTNFVLDLLDKDTKIKYLEPAFGSGSFYNSIISNLNTKNRINVVGIEKDTEIYEFSNQLWDFENLTLYNEDFTNLSEESIGKFNLLITNPPYVRHQHLTKEEKKYLKDRVKKELSINVSGYSGLYIYFILLADKFLEEGAIASWLIPAEFMSSKYGEALIKYLTERVELYSINYFDTEISNFDNAVVSSVVITYFKKTPSENHKVKIISGFNLSNEYEVALNEMKTGEKWSNIIKKTTTLKDNHIPKIGDFFDVRRGVATGNNNLFIIDESKMKELELRSEFYKYIIPSVKLLDSDIIEADEHGKPLINECRYLINTKLSMDELKQSSQKLYEYFLDAEKKGDNQGYLLSQRKPWYKQEQREPAPYLCTYMGRSKNEGEKPFRLIRNYSKAITTNNYLLMYPKGPLKALFLKDPNSIDKVFEILNNLDSKYYLDYGRGYGGGLKKVEPKELSNIPVPELVEYITRQQVKNKI